MIVLSKKEECLAMVHAGIREEREECCAIVEGYREEYLVIVLSSRERSVWQ